MAFDVLEQMHAIVGRTAGMPGLWRASWTRMAYAWGIYAQVPDEATRAALMRLSDQLGPPTTAVTTPEPTGGYCCTFLLYDPAGQQVILTCTVSDVARSEGLEPPTF
jgi:hypothetical protein